MRKAQIKAKKRKPINFDLLVQQDIKVFLEKQGNQGTVAQGTSSQVATGDQEMALRVLIQLKEPSTLQVIESQGYSLKVVTEDQEMEVIDTTEAFLPPQGADESTNPRSSSLQSLN